MAAAGVPVPFSGGGGSASFNIEGRPSPPGDPGPHGDIAYVTPDYFSTMKIALRRGRTFTEHDQEGSQPVVMIDETLARQYWPNEDPIGKHMRRGSRAPWATIIGVVAHVKNSDLAGDVVKGRYYYPVFQVAPPMITFLLRTQSDAASFGAVIRDAVLAVDPTQPVSNVKTLSDMVQSSLASRRFVVTLLGVFAGIALLMAVLGLYGIISYTVAQRTQEIGIRMALGAERGAVLRLVIGQGMRLAVAGALIGLIASLAISGLLRNLLFGVSIFDPLTFAAMALVLIGAAFAASYVPAHRATRVDPMTALRYE
jgi:predicted permease